MKLLLSLILSLLILSISCEKGVFFSKERKVQQIWKIVSYSGNLPFIQSDTTYSNILKCASGDSLANSITIERNYYIKFYKRKYSLLEERLNHSELFVYSECKFYPIEESPDYYTVSKGNWNFYDSKENILLEEYSSGYFYLLEIVSLDRKHLEVKNKMNDTYQFAMFLEPVKKSEERDYMEQYF